MKLTDEILNRLIQEVIQEVYDPEHCKDLPIKEKAECVKADTESRDRSADRRRKKEMYQTIPTPMQQLSKGIVEEQPQTLTEKFKAFLKTLTPEERGRLLKAIKKPSQRELQEYCSKWKDAVDGKLTVDPKDIADLKIKKAKMK